MPRRSGFRYRSGGSEERRAGVCRSAGEAADAEAVKQFKALASDLQYPGAGMPHELARQVKQAPAHGSDLMALPTIAESGMLEKYEEIVREDADVEKDGIGGKLPPGHTLHAKANLQCLGALLGHLATLTIPNQGACGDSTRLLAITGYFGDGLLGRSGQPTANGEGLAGVFTVIADVRLVTGRVETDVGGAVSLGQARFARLNEFGVLRRRRDGTFPEVVVDHPPPASAR